MSLSLTFNPPITYTPPTPQSISYTAAEIVQMRDLPADKQVWVNLRIDGVGRKELLLWEGAEYDTAGQWTDSDVTARVTELLGNGN